MLLFFTGIIHYRVFLFFRRSLNRQPCTHQTYRAGNERTHVQYERALSWRGVLQVIVFMCICFQFLFTLQREYSITMDVCW